MPHRLLSLALATALLLAVTACLVFLPTRRTQSVSDAAESRIVTALQQVSEQVRLLRADMARELRHASSVGLSPESVESRKELVDTKPVAGATAELEASVQKLTNLVEHLTGRAGTEPSAVVAARLRHPEPFTSVVAALVASLAKDRLKERDWLLLGMPQVIQRLGTPNVVLADRRVQRWEYFDASGKIILVVEFTDGLVTRLST